MRVIFNSMSALKARAGIGGYTANLLDAMVRLAGPDEVRPFPGGWMATAAATSYKLLAGKGSNGSGGGGGWRARIAGLARETGRRAFQGAFRAACLRTRFDVYHEPNYIPWATDLPTVITIHDLSVLLHPEWHPADRVEYHARHFEQGLRRASKFITASEFARGEIIEHLGVPAERVATIPYGIAPEYRPLPDADVKPVLARLGLPSRYLLFVSTIEPRKNVKRLLEVYCSLPSPVRTKAPLVLAGGWGWNAADVRDYYDSTARHRGVRHLGYVAAADLPALYNGARALVYPSYYEGFGLPPVEMLACGGAVLASTAGAIQEVLSGYPGLIPADDPDAWRNAIYRVVTDNDWWARLRAGAEERARPYTWERCGRETLAVYRELSRAA